MSLHNKPEANTPELHAAMINHGLPTDRPDQLADAFRLGWLAAQPDWEPSRCEDCICEYGGADCADIKGTRNG